jgi:hypothetical protein
MKGNVPWMENGVRGLNILPVSKALHPWRLKWTFLVRRWGLSPEIPRLWNCCCIQSVTDWRAVRNTEEVNREMSKKMPCAFHSSYGCLSLSSKGTRKFCNVRMSQVPGVGLCVESSGLSDDTLHHNNNTHNTNTNYIPAYYIKLGHGRLLTNVFQFIIHSSPFHSTLFSLFFLSKAVPLYAMEALMGRGDIAPTHSRPRH